MIAINCTGCGQGSLVWELDYDYGPQLEGVPSWPHVRNEVTQEHCTQCPDNFDKNGFRKNPEGDWGKTGSRVPFFRRLRMSDKDKRLTGMFGHGFAGDIKVIISKFLPADTIMVSEHVASLLKFLPDAENENEVSHD